MIPKAMYQVAMKPTQPYTNYSGYEGPWCECNKQAYTVYDLDKWAFGRPTADTDHERGLEARHSAFEKAP